MSLAHPALNTTGRRRGKQKFASAAAKRRHEELVASEAALLAKWAPNPQLTAPKRQPLDYKLTVPAGRTTGLDVPSLNTGHTGAVATKATPQYTGDRIIGIGTLHKSNGVPIFSDQEAKEISSMRR